MKCLTVFSSGVGGPETFREIRLAFQTVFDQSWESKYEIVKQLHKLPETCDSAYWWCQHNRFLYARGELALERSRLLDEIDWWTWGVPRDERWEERYESIRTLDRQPKSGTPEYAFVRQQRRLYDQNRLPKDRIALLEQIGWWRWANNRSNWEKDYCRIQNLTEAPKPRTKNYDWVKHQRRMYREGKLPDGRVEKLEKIEWWSWNTGSEDKWLQTIERVAALAQPPSSYEPEYQWVRKQKKRHQAGRLEAWKIELLEAVTWWRWE